MFSFIFHSAQAEVMQPSQATFCAPDRLGSILQSDSSRKRFFRSESLRLISRLTVRSIWLSLIAPALQQKRDERLQSNASAKRPDRQHAASCECFALRTPHSGKFHPQSLPQATISADSYCFPLESLQKQQNFIKSRKSFPISHLIATKLTSRLKCSNDPGDCSSARRPFAELPRRISAAHDSLSGCEIQRTSSPATCQVVLQLLLALPQNCSYSKQRLENHFLLTKFNFRIFHSSEIVRPFRRIRRIALCFPPMPIRAQIWPANLAYQIWISQWRAASN